MKVLTIVNKLDMGGIEKTLLSCLPTFIEYGIEMHILCHPGGALEKAYRSAGATLINCDSCRSPVLLPLVLRRLIRKHNYDVVHSRGGHTSGFLAQVCYNMNTPFVVSVHSQKAMFKNTWENHPLLKPVRNYYLSIHKNLTNRYASAIIGHSKVNLQYFDLDSRAKKFQVIYNGIDFRNLDTRVPLLPQKERALRQFIAHSEKVIIHIGSFRESKNHEFLINVFNKLNPVQNNFKLILIGEGALLGSIKEKVRSLNLGNNVMFTGMETNIRPYIEVSDVFFFPSLHEGFGNVLIEAQYLGLTICASRINTHFESVCKEYQEFFFNPESVTEAVEKLKRALYSNLNNNYAITFAKGFSVENMVDNLVSVYKDITSHSVHEFLEPKKI